VQVTYQLEPVRSIARHGHCSLSNRVNDMRPPDLQKIDRAIDLEVGTNRRTTRRLTEATHADLERVAAGEHDPVLVAARYRVERALGRGGTASVFAAYDLIGERPVALKVLSEESCARPPLRARFLREARLHGRVRHPNVVELLDSGSTDAGLIYLTMELLDGEDLGRTLARCFTLPWPQVRELMLEICAGLAAIHAAGVVHRDLKPSNCFRVIDELDPLDESIQLVDFGIATAVDEPRTRRLTLADQIVGTPEYMSPEQARGDPVDHRSDIYAAGLLLGELLTGSLPFRARTSPAMLAAQIYEPPPKLRSLLPPHVQIPAALEPIYERALAKQPDRRFVDVEQLAAALRAIEPAALVSISLPPAEHPPTEQPPAEHPALRPRRSLRDAVTIVGLIVLILSILSIIGTVGALVLAPSLGPPN
jgi:serine/threonine-protein kinase